MKHEYFANTLTFPGHSAFVRLHVKSRTQSVKVSPTARTRDRLGARDLADRSANDRALREPTARDSVPAATPALLLPGNTGLHLARLSPRYTARTGAKKVKHRNRLARPS